MGIISTSTDGQIVFFVFLLFSCLLINTITKGESEEGGDTSDEDASSGHDAGDSDAGDRAASSVLWLKDCLQRHNDKRTEQGKTSLTINYDIVKAAKTFAEQLAGDCDFHSTKSNRIYGENLFFIGGKADDSCEDPVSAWMKGEALYNSDDPKFDRKTGAYTQAVWRGTTEIGCARAAYPPGNPNCKYNGGTVIVCYYNPFGNVAGAFADNV